MWFKAQGAEQAPARFVFCVFFKRVIRDPGWSCLMPSHCGPTSPPCSVPQHVPSLLFPTHSEPCDPRTRGESGRLAEHSPLTSAGVLSLRALELATSLPQYVCELARQAPRLRAVLGQQFFKALRSRRRLVLGCGCARSRQVVCHL